MGRLKTGESVTECIADLADGLEKPRKILDFIHHYFAKQKRQMDFLRMMHVMDDLGLYGEKINRLFERACGDDCPAAMIAFMAAANNAGIQNTKVIPQLIRTLAEPRVAYQKEDTDCLSLLTNRCFALEKAKTGEKANAFDFGAGYRDFELN